MRRIDDGTDFARILASLGREHQLALAKRFIADVMPLSRSARLGPLQNLLNKPSCSLDDIKAAQDIALAVYVEKRPPSELSRIRFECQASHFIAQAVMACTALVDDGGDSRHLAQQVANYCRMAQTCASMSHDDEGPDFDLAERAYKRIVQRQFDIANDYLASLQR